MLSIYGEEIDQESTLEPWTISPMAFSGDEAYSKLFPSLILDSIPKNITRITTFEENSLLYEKQLKNEKNSLYQKINDIKDNMDKLFFQNISSTEKNKKRIEYENQIKEIENEIQKINENLNIKNDFGELEKIIKIENTFVSNDFLENFINQDKINGVLSGTVTEQNGFIFVKAKITVLAEETFSYETSSVGTYGDIKEIAGNIAGDFLSFLMNKEKITVSVSVFPEEIRNQVSITIDGNLYKNQVEKLSLQQGEHIFSIEAPGFTTRNFSASLDDSHKSYNYSVYLEETSPENLEVFFNAEKIDQAEKSQDELTLYVGGIKSPLDFSNDSIFASVIVENPPVLGEITIPIVTGTEEETKYASTFFRLTGETIKPIIVQSESSSSLIEKARKRMYTSYGVFLLTLPFSFYTNGRMVDITNTINSGLYTDEMLRKYNSWKIASGISLGISVSAGVNMLIQLGRYIYTANSVLPQNR